jgi:hypothetical protein
MTTSVNGRAGLWLDGVTWAANDLRLELAAALLTSASATGTTGIAAAQGVRPSVGSPLLSTWTSGMAFTLNAGTCWVQGTASATAGIYTATLDTTTTLTVPNGDPTNPRIDSVIAVISDVGTSSSTTIFKILAGVPAGSPVHTALPANAVRLCDIAVAASASVLSAPNFNDLRPFTVALGGILPYGNVSGATIPGPVGTYVHDLTTGRLKVLNGSGTAVTPKVVASGPVSSNSGGATTVTGGSSVTLVSVSVTADGLTEYEVTLRIAFVWQNSTSSGSDFLTIAAQLDGSDIDSLDPTLGQYLGPGPRSFLWQTWVTPSAGSHTFSMLATASATHQWACNTSYIRVAPSPA